MLRSRLILLNLSKIGSYLSALVERAVRIARSQDVPPTLFLGLWPFIFYWPVTFGQQSFYANDIFKLFFPLQTELARALAEGRLPLWTPYLQGGFPLFAEGEIGALYPFNLIFHALLPIPIAFSYSILFHLAWASIGMYALSRAAGLRVSAALLGAFCFGFSGFFTAHLQHAPHLAVASWLPWLVLCQQRYWQTRSVEWTPVLWFLLSALAIALQLLAGFPQMALINLAVFALLGFFAPVVWSENAKGERPVFSVRAFGEATFVTLLSVILGVCLAAVQLVPTLELIGFSIRGQVMSSAFFTSFSLEPVALTQLISPFAHLGTPDIGNMEYWGYVGVLPLFFVLLAPFRRRDVRTWVFVLLGLSSMVLALGSSTPIYQWLYYVPVFNRFRVPARFLFPFTFAVSYLAATGFHDLQDRVYGAGRFSRVSLIASVVIGLCTFSLVGLGYKLPSETWMDVWQWLPIVLVLSSAGMILATILQRIPPSVFRVATIGLTVLDLVFFSIPFLDLNGRVPPSETVSVPRTVLAMDQTSSVYRVYSVKPPSTGSAARAALSPNFSLQYAKQGVGIYAPLEFQRVSEYLDHMTLTMSSLMNIRYYLLPLETFPGEPSPFDPTEPRGGLTLNVLSHPPNIPPTQVAKIEVTSYTDHTGQLPDGSLVGELELELAGNRTLTLPIRVGIETGDWDYDALTFLGKVGYTKPINALSFPAYLPSIGHGFEGHKYTADFDIAQTGSSPPVLVKIGVRSFLPGAGLTIENVSLIDVRGRAVSLAALLRRKELVLVFRSHTAAMWEDQSALPRAFMVHSAENVDDDQALAQLEQPDFRPDQVVLLADGQAIDERNDTVPAPTKDQVTIVDYKSERVEIKVTAADAGYLVLTDSWYPGWEASVDGQSTPIHRADYIFRAVQLQPGEHTVVFEYRPWSFAIGAIISGLSLIVCILLIIVSHYRSSRFSGRTATAEAS